MKIKVILALIYFVIFISGCYCQNQEESLIGQWTLKMSDDGDWYPDVLILRSDQKYLIFNDFDFVGFSDTLLKSDIITDDKKAMAFTETGNWRLDLSGRLLIFEGRTFLKENSLFNEYYGKEEGLVLFIKELFADSLVLCLSPNEIQCDKYVRNYNPAKRSDFRPYKELSLKFAGTESRKIEIPLSGFETEIVLSYHLRGYSVELIVTDLKERIIFSDQISPTTDREIRKIPIRGVTKLFT